MSSSETLVLPLSTWLPSSLVSLIAFIANYCILTREHRKRIQRETPFSSKCLSLSPLLTVTFGPLFCIANTLQYYNGICLIAGNLNFFLFWSQFAALQCFQLSRLYYSFSETKTYSKRGYPKWIFVLLSLWMTFAVISGIIGNGLITKCYITESGDFTLQKYGFSFTLKL